MGENFSRQRADEKFKMKQQNLNERRYPPCPIFRGTRNSPKKKPFLFVLKCKKKGKEIIFLYQLETKSIHLFLFKKYLTIVFLCSEPSVSFLLS
jgi:hypothetical protein